MSSDFDKLFNEVKPLLKKEELEQVIKTLEKSKPKALSKKCKNKADEIYDLNVNVRIPFVIYRDTFETILNDLPSIEEKGELIIKGVAMTGPNDLMYLNKLEYPCLEWVWVHYSEDFKEYMFLCMKEVNIYGELIIENKSNIKLEERDYIYIEGEEFVVINDKTIIRATPFGKVNPGHSKITDILNEYVNKLRDKYHKGGKSDGK